jgi:SAM-dependent methyltransferase
MRKPLFLARQGRRPHGLLGDLVGRLMARETAPENDVALDLLALEPHERLVEIGCGHGHTLAKAAALAPGAAHAGLDFSWRMHIRPEAEVTAVAGAAGFEVTDVVRRPFGRRTVAFLLAQADPARPPAVRRFAGSCGPRAP